MIYIAKDNKSLYLSHHGIKGQHWGKRNGPPYPLDEDISTGKRLKEKKKNADKKTKKKTIFDKQIEKAKKLRKQAEKLIDKISTDTDKFVPSPSQKRELNKLLNTIKINNQFNLQNSINQFHQDMINFNNINTINQMNTMHTLMNMHNF